MRCVCAVCVHVHCVQVSHKEAECDHLRAQLGKAGASPTSQLFPPEGILLGTESERAVHFSKMTRQLELELEAVRRPRLLLWCCR